MWEKEDIDLLFSKYIRAESTPEEVLVVEELLENEANLKRFEALVKLEGMLADGKEFQVLKDRKTEAHLRFSEYMKQSDNSKQYPFPWKWVGVAAAVIAVAFFLLNSPLVRGPEDQWVEAGKDSLRVTLADGSLCVLYPNASLRVNEQFDSLNRDLKLRGGAYFSVAENPELPFKVSLGELSATVLGTQFHLWEARDRVYLNVTDGVVAFSDGSKELQCIKGEAAEWNGNGKGEISRVKRYNPNFMLTGVLEYINVPVIDVLSEVQDYYGLTVEYDEAEIRSCLFTGRFDHQSAPAVIEAISANYSWSLEADGNIYRLKAESCDP